MLDVNVIVDAEVGRMSPEALTALALQMQQHLMAQQRVIEQHAQVIEQHARVIELKDIQLSHKTAELTRKDAELKFKSTKLEKLNFELARLKAWKFGAKSEAMSAEQRRLFEETLSEDEASLRAQLEELQGQTDPDSEPDSNAQAKTKESRRPKRQTLPEHLRRVEHRHEPEDTRCPSEGCGQPMVRIGEDVSERLDIIPAEFFVHRHIYGKWACKCCERLVQEPAEPQLIDNGIPAAGLVTHTLISRFVDHVPYYRQESVNARSGVHTPRSTLAQWSGRAGAALEPLHGAHRRFILSSRVLHADETPVAVLDPGAGKTKRAYVWAYARGAFDATPGVIYDFCAGRAAQYPIQFLGPPQDPRDDTPPWQGTLVRDEYAAYDSVLDARTQPGRIAAGCAAHARRKFDELLKAKASAIAPEALRRFAEIYRVERELVSLRASERLARRQEISRPLWEQLQAWLQGERCKVPEGGAAAKAIDYSLKHWAALTLHLSDSEVPMDNNHLERQIRPWAMGRRAWLFAGSELAGQRAAIVMSLLQSAKLNGHDPHAYLSDVLQRLPSHPARRIEELLPHCWRPR
jgi:transposase